VQRKLVNYKERVLECEVRRRELERMIVESERVRTVELALINFVLLNKILFV
jgi:hypothetical protein